MGAEDDRTEDAAPTEQSFGEAGKLRRPTKGEIADAIEQTPTVEEQGPGIPVPSYLAKEEGRVAGTVAKGEPTPVDGAPAAGFTDTPSSDPTEATDGLATRIEDERPTPAREGNPERRGMFILVAAVAFAVAALVAIVTMLD